MRRVFHVVTTAGVVVAVTVAPDFVPVRDWRESVAVERTGITV